ncbi:hypothetical protein PVAP13_8NG216311 [Panicum virgatum]|uniref:Uncharacterized protein n=1 Tax=Panicum virgatum TaxID=38727 RepID=A0A8T0PBL7_PANVG|nr:hypothetical protein PVAP13_8NG216311 [Panicum virgatum]
MFLPRTKFFSRHLQTYRRDARRHGATGPQPPHSPGARFAPPPAARRHGLFAAPHAATTSFPSCRSLRAQWRSPPPRPPPPRAARHRIGLLPLPRSRSVAGCDMDQAQVPPSKHIFLFDPCTLAALRFAGGG